MTSFKTSSLTGGQMKIKERPDTIFFTFPLSKDFKKDDNIQGW